MLVDKVRQGPGLATRGGRSGCWTTVDKLCGVCIPAPLSAALATGATNATNASKSSGSNNNSLPTATPRCISTTTCLGVGGQAALVDGLGEEGKLVLGEAEALLQDERELLDALVVLAQHVLRVGGADDDLRADGGHANLHAGVTSGAQLADEELVELSMEHAIGDELALLSGGGGGGGGDGGVAEGSWSRRIVDESLLDGDERASSPSTAAGAEGWSVSTEAA
jgi:hypothetical protein